MSAKSGVWRSFQLVAQQALNPIFDPPPRLLSAHGVEYLLHLDAEVGWGFISDIHVNACKARERAYPSFESLGRTTPQQTPAHSGAPWLGRWGPVNHALQSLDVEQNATLLSRDRPQIDELSQMQSDLERSHAQHAAEHLVTQELH